MMWDGKKALSQRIFKEVNLNVCYCMLQMLKLTFLSIGVYVICTCIKYV